MQKKKLTNKIIFEELLEKNDYVNSMQILSETHPDLLKDYVDEYFFFILKDIKDYHNLAPVKTENFSTFNIFDLFIENITNENHKQVALIVKSLIEDLCFLKETKEDSITKYDFIENIEDHFERTRIYHELIGQINQLRSHIEYLDSRLH